MNARLTAANILHQVAQHGRSLQDVFNEQVPSDCSSTNHGLIKELVYGVLRIRSQLTFISNKLLNSPLKNKDALVLELICIGIYQLLAHATADYASVSETVNAAKSCKQPWAPSLVNKLLRRFQAEKTTFIEQLKHAPEETLYAHPKWLLSALKSAWPSQWQAIAEANNTQPPMSLRVNEQQQNRSSYLQKLTASDLLAKITKLNSTGITLDKPTPINRIPDFQQGSCSIQDLAGQQVISFLDLKPGQRVLDACAAPGGKTCHMLEAEKNLERLVAIDQDPTRMLKIKENINRLQLPHNNLQLVLADITHTKEWWDGSAFDRILVDAPCSATGVIRRHPDIKLLRRETDIQLQVQLQNRILNNLWPLLKKGGRLVYTTCSILPAENQQLIQQFLKEHKDAKEIKHEVSWALATNPGYQLLPGNNYNTDGFYYATLTKS